MKTHKRPRMHNSSPRVKVVDRGRDGYGRALLAGLNYQDLRAILCCAALHCHDSVKREGDNPHGRYSAQMLKLIQFIDERAQDALMATFPRGSKRAPTRADRWAAVHEES